MSEKPQDEWKDLAVLAQKGDKKAYAQLLRGILPHIQKIITPRLANPEWADDITQEVLMSVHKSLKTYSGDRPFKPWLNSIIYYRKTDFLRKYYSNKQNVSVPAEDQINLKSDVTSPEDMTEYKNIEKALEEFPEKQQKVFRMIKIEGYSAQEVAAEMDMSESAVKVSAHRTMEKLKQNLN